VATEATAGAATSAHAPASDTLALTQNLLRRRSVTPDDQGCQALIAERLQAIAPQRDDISTFFDLLDLDDHASFGGRG